LFSAVTFWVTAAACTLAGGIVGWLANRMFAPGEHERRQLEAELDKAREELASFRSDVTEHFKGTADRINRLTEDYRDLHQHLSAGALGLCEATGSNDVPMLNSLSSSQRDAPAQSAPPLDYAPRGADKPGVLNEDYDLDRLRP